MPEEGMDLPTEVTIGTGTTRAVYVPTAREASTQRPMFDVRTEADLGDLMVRARRAHRSADDELRAVSIPYARHLIDRGAYHHSPRFRLAIGDEVEVLEPVRQRQ